MAVPLAEIEPAGAAAELALAFGIGLLIGVERERRKGTGPTRGPAGIRTFALTGLLGGICAQFGGVAIVAVGAGFIGLAAIAGYLRELQDGGDDPGLTTEVALVLTFLLGALVHSEPALSAALAVAVALILANRERFHRIARETLSEQEIHDGLLMAAAALIVLPLVPNEGLGPNEALNPFLVWQLVVIIMAVQGVGYVALRAIGPRYGLLVSGFISGFVSSTLTVATMGARARDEPKLLRPAVGAAVASTVATVILLAIVLAATSPETLREVLVPLIFAGLAAVGYAAVVTARMMRTKPSEDISLGRAFEFKTAILLALVLSAVLIVTAALNELIGVRGVTLGAAVAGFADSQSAAASAAALADSGRITPAAAAIPVLAALSTNTISKAVLAWGAGTRRYAVEVCIGLAIVLAAAWGGWAITQVIG